MKIYDISQEVFSCQLYSGDEAPSKREDMRISRGDLYNLTSFSMCAHNGTHIDAPFHFLEDGDTVDQIPLEKLVGDCYVSEQNQDIDGEKACQILANAKGIKRILIKGTGIVTLAAAQVFAEAVIDLIGVEGQSVGPEDAPLAVRMLLDQLFVKGYDRSLAEPCSVMGRNHIPALLIQSERDGLISPSSARAFQTRAQEVGNECELYWVVDQKNTHSWYTAGMFLESREENQGLDKFFSWIAEREA